MKKIEGWKGFSFFLLVVIIALLMFAITQIHPYKDGGIVEVAPTFLEMKTYDVYNAREKILYVVVKEYLFFDEIEAKKFFEKSLENMSTNQ